MHGIIKDDDAVLQIDAAIRRVKVPAGGRVIGVAGDHRSEQLTIQCPRFVEGHDLAGCAMKWISWKNAAGEHGESKITGAEIDADGNILMTWTAEAGLLLYAGAVTFAVCFMDLDSQGRVLYKWGTGWTDMQVLDSPGKRVEHGVALEYVPSDAEGSSGLLQVKVDDGRLNAAAVAAVRKVLYG